MKILFFLLFSISLFAQYTAPTDSTDNLHILQWGQDDNPGAINLNNNMAKIDSGYKRNRDSLVALRSYMGDSTVHRKGLDSIGGLKVIKDSLKFSPTGKLSLPALKSPMIGNISLADSVVIIWNSILGTYDTLASKRSTRTIDTSYVKTTGTEIMHGRYTVKDSMKHDGVVTFGINGVLELPYEPTNYQTWNNLLWVNNGRIIFSEESSPTKDSVAFLSDITDGDSMATWGNITGVITNQGDLISAFEDFGSSVAVSNDTLFLKNGDADIIGFAILPTSPSPDTATFVTKASTQVLTGSKYFTQVIQGTVRRAQGLFNDGETVAVTANDLASSITSSGIGLSLKDIDNNTLSSANIDTTVIPHKQAANIFTGANYFTNIIQGGARDAYNLYDAAGDTLYDADDFGQKLTVSGTTLTLRNSKYTSLSSITIPSGGSTAYSDSTGTLKNGIYNYFSDPLVTLNADYATSSSTALEVWNAGADESFNADELLKVSNNLSDLQSSSTARGNLGLVIGTNVQAYDADLTTYAGIAPSVNVQSILGAANYSAINTLLGLGSLALINNNFTANRVMTSNGAAELTPSDITTTELDYLDNVTSNIQTQINAKVTSVSTDSTVITTDSGFVVKGIIANTPQIITSITSNTLTPTSSIVYWNGGSNGALQTLVGKKDGQELTIINIHATTTLTIYDPDDLGINIYVTDGLLDIVLGYRDIAKFIYVKSLNAWFLESHSNN